MESKVLVFYHGNDWDGVPARQRYLMAALSEYIPVIYVDGRQDKRGRVTYAYPQENVTVVRGLASLVTALRRRRIEFLARPVVRWHLRWLRKRYRHIIFWSMENWLGLERLVSHDRMIFDCIDPAFTTDPEHLRQYDERERRILKKADLVFASADALAEHCRNYNKNVVLLNNACAPEEYQPCLVEQSPRPDWWPQTMAPIAAYLGTIDLRFDFDIVESACMRNPDVHFIFAGSVHPELAPRLAPLRALPNVTIPGKISVSEGRYLLSRCTIGLIPFRIGSMNDTINPVKMYAYALLGKPIVGTAVRELMAHPEVVSAAATSDDFHRAISAAIDESQDQENVRRLRAFALTNTWDARAAQAWDCLETL